MIHYPDEFSGFILFSDAAKFSRGCINLERERDGINSYWNRFYGMQFSIPSSRAVSGAWLLDCTAFSAADGPTISLTVSISKLVVVALFLFLRS